MLSCIVSLSANSWRVYSTTVPQLLKHLESKCLDNAQRQCNNTSTATHMKGLPSTRMPKLYSLFMTGQSWSI